MANFLLKSKRMDDDTTVDAIDNRVADLEEQFSIALVGNTSLIDVSTTGPYVATADHDHDTVYEVLGKGVTGGDAHDHTGGGGAQIDHTDLLNIGTNTHAQIDTFIGTTADLTYAPIAKGVTDGDSHDHTEGAGAAITEGAITLADVTTLDVSGSMHGLAPKLPGADPTNKYLRGDGTWVTPPGLGESISEDDITLAIENTTNDVSITKHGFVPIAPNDATKFLGGLGAWVTPISTVGLPTDPGVLHVAGGVPVVGDVVEEDITLAAESIVNDVSATVHGFVPVAPDDETLFLRGDGTWDVATVTEDEIGLTAESITGDVNGTTHGFVPILPAVDPETKFLRGDGTWAVANDEGSLPAETGLYHIASGAMVTPATLLVNDDVHASAGIVESKLALNNPTHAAVTLGTDAGAVLGLTGQQIDLDTQVANRVFAGPATGADADPTFRALVAADIPDHASTHQHGGSDVIATATAGANEIPKAGASGKLAIGWIPTGTAGTEVCLGNDARLPSTNEKAALAGQGGYAPTGSNLLITNNYLVTIWSAKADAVHASRHLQGGADTLHQLLEPKAHQHTEFNAGLVLHGTFNTTNGDVVAGSGNISGAAITASGALQGATVKATGAFGCNGATVKTSYASGGAPAAASGIEMPDPGYYATCFATSAAAVAFRTLVANIHAALVANGIMS